MKTPFKALLGAAGLALVSCESLQQPISNESGYDPLRAPGSSFSSPVASSPGFESGPTFSPGSFAETSVPDAAFFSSVPKGDAKASRLLKRGQSVKVVSMKKSYAKVELSDGAIGYVPAIMLEEPDSSASSNSGNAPAVVVAGTGSGRKSQSAIPDLPDPIEDPGNPDDLPIPDFTDNSPITPLPEIPQAPDVPQAPDAQDAPSLEDKLEELTPGLPDAPNLTAPPEDIVEKVVDTILDDEPPPLPDPIAVDGE